MRTIQAAIVGFSKPFFTYNANGYKHLPTQVESGSESISTLESGDQYFEADTIEQVMAEFDRLGFVMPEIDQWDFPELPLRISMTFEDWTNLITDIPDFAMMVTAFKDTMINRNDRRYFYLSEVYPEHEAIFSSYQSYLKESRN